MSCMKTDKQREREKERENGCEKALQLCWYNQRHDRVLAVIKQLVLEYMPETH